MNTKLVRKRAKATMLKALMLLCLTTTTAFASNASADDTADSRSNLTFVAKPYEKSKNYMIYEIGFKMQVFGPSFRYKDAYQMWTVDLGMMHNLNEKTAIGVSLYGSSGFLASTLGIKPRIRRWLDKSRGVDFSAGLLFLSHGNSPYSGKYKWPGFISSVSVDMFRWLSADLSLETLSLNKGGSVTSLYLGVNGKDYAALAETGFLVALVAIVLLTWNWDSGSGWY